MTSTGLISDLFTQLAMLGISQGFVLPSIC